MRNYDAVRFNALYSLIQPTLTSYNNTHKGVEFPHSLFRPDVDLGFRDIISDPSRTEMDIYIGFEHEPWIDAVSGILFDCCIDFNFSDTHLSLEEMLKYRVIFASLYDFMSEEEQKKLEAYVRSGGTLVAGPGMPYLNRQMEGCRILESCFEEMSLRAGENRFLQVREVREEDLPRVGLRAAFQARGIETAVYRRGSQVLLFAANRGNLPITARICFDGKKEFTPKWPKGELFTGEGGIEVTLSARSVLVWEVQDCV